MDNQHWAGLPCALRNNVNNACTHTHTHTHTHRDRQTDRHRETDTERDRQTDRVKERDTERDRGRLDSSTHTISMVEALCLLIVPSS